MDCPTQAPRITHRRRRAPRPGKGALANSRGFSCRRRSAASAANRSILSSISTALGRPFLAMASLHGDGDQSCMPNFPLCVDNSTRMLSGDRRNEFSKPTGRARCAPQISTDPGSDSFEAHQIDSETYFSTATHMRPLMLCGGPSMRSVQPSFSLRATDRIAPRSTRTPGQWQ